MRICGEEVDYGDRLRVTTSYTSPVTMSDSITGVLSVMDVDDDGNETIDIRCGGFDCEIHVRDIVGIEHVE